MNHPLPIFHFQVEWGGAQLAFSEVSGLEIETEVIEYRNGADPEYAPRKMPGLKKYGNIVLKRGVVRGDNEFFDWLNNTLFHNTERRDITISLLDEEHHPVMIWQAKNAWPCKISSPDLKASSSEVAIEVLEVCHEGLTIQNG